MDASQPAKKQLQIQGPRPPPLSVRKDSHKIRKPPKPPQGFPQQPPAPAPNDGPVIIYAISPKVVHATVSNFMSVVQRLTGLSSDDFSDSGEVSPAARLAATESASPRERTGPGSGTDREDMMIGMVEEGGVELGQVPGILSPSPETLPPVSAGFFSPGSDPSRLSILQDLSPSILGSNFIGSPSSLLLAPLGSPTFSPDVFGQLWNF